MNGDHNQFMAMAIEEARSGMRAGERPFGSVVVQDGTAVGRGHNMVTSTLDPTAHAETTAIRNAAANLKLARLPGCTLYTTCEPCPMCCGAAIYAGIDTLVMGTRYTTLVQVSRGVYQLHDYTVERLVDMTRSKMKVVTGVRSEECDAIYRDWQDWATIKP